MIGRDGGSDIPVYKIVNSVKRWPVLRFDFKLHVSPRTLDLA